MKNKNNQEHVVLIDKNNNVLGTYPKLEAHNKNTPLHRGFSIFLFNKENKLLLQQRSKNKKTWPLVWSNSCCGHPRLNESNVDAAKRRLKFELGIEPDEIFEVLPNFSYKVERDGVVENELCPILVGFSNQKPLINKEEVNNVAWIEWNEFIAEIKNNPEKYSEWCVLEAREIKNNPQFLSLFYKH